MAFVFGLQTLQITDFTKNYWLKGLAPKKKDQTNFRDIVIWRESIGVAENPDVYGW